MPDNFAGYGKFLYKEFTRESSSAADNSHKNNTGFFMTNCCFLSLNYNDCNVVEKHLHFQYEVDAGQHAFDDIHAVIIFLPNVNDVVIEVRWARNLIASDC